MSGLAVCWSLAGAPLSPALVASMTGAVPHRGPDGVGHWIDGAVGLGHCLLATTPEAVGERQPLVDGPLALTFDGRIDNRDELLQALRPHARIETPIVSDATIVLFAYRRWGAAVAEHLLGDFAFCLWDAGAQRIVCARDPFGLKPLYYSLSPNRWFLAASEPRQLLASGCVSAEPHPGMLAEYLACRVTHPRETLFAHILRLPAAHALVVERGAVRLTRYWTPNPSPVRCRSDADYADAFLARAADAVRSRLRAPGPVGVELSGGVDSTTVVGLARELEGSGRHAGVPVETFSLVCPGLPCDETTFIDEAVTALGGPATRLPPGDPLAPGLDPLPEFPWFPNGTAFNPLARAANAKGVRVILTGHGGDEWFTGSRYHLADLLGSLQLGQAWRRLRGMYRVRAVGAMSLPPHPLYQYGLVPLAPDWIRRLVRSWRPRRQDDAYPWISRQLKGDVALADRLRSGVAPPDLPTHAQRDIVRYMVSGLMMCDFEMGEHLHSRFHVEQRHPLYDVRLTEWALGLPEAQRWDGAETKAVLRRAMRGRIPERIRTRETKAEFSAFLAQALIQAHGAGPFRAPALAAAGYVVEPELARMYTAMSTLYASREEGYPSLAWPLWMVHAAEQWYRRGHDA